MKVILEKKTDTYFLKVARFERSTNELLNIIQNDLADIELIYFRDLKHEKRKKEWLSVRILLKDMLGNYLRIFYDEFGNPFIKNKYQISVTHSKNIAGIILSKSKDTGIDSELISDRILRTAHKFIPENVLFDFPEDTKIDYCYLHWCGKETLFKIQGGGGIDFIEHLQIKISELRNNGTIIGTYSYKDIKEYYEISYQFLHSENDKILITWY